MADNLYWVWLSQGCRYGTDTFDRLVRRFHSSREIYQAGRDELVEAVGSLNADVMRLCDKDLSEATRIMNYCVASQTGILSYGDEDYPARLRMLQDPPPVLYYRGRRPALDSELLISVVGTRKMSEYGKRMAFEISYDLARAGAVVVTGMALGIDGVASAAAVEAGANTVAVLGSGIDIVYPREHQRLMEAICRVGTVISEFAPGTSPEGRNFPRRNRIISGLSQGTFVVEGNRHSGALITARHAEKQGRDIFALPGNADEENSESTALLLKQGAHPVTCADDILRFYEPLYSDRLNIFKLLEPMRCRPAAVLSALRVAARAYYRSYRELVPSDRPPQEKEKVAKRKIAPAPRKEERVQRTPSAPQKEEGVAEPPSGTLALLDANTLAVYQKMPRGRALTPDEICVAGNFPAGQVMAALTILEIHKCVSSLPGGRYLRT